MARAGTLELVSRIWARDASLWTGTDEGRWPGWLSEPARSREQVAEAADLGAEFFRFEFATAVAGSLMELNPFDQPDVQEAKERAETMLAGDEQPSVEPMGSLDALVSLARPRDYFCVQTFVEPSPSADARIAVLRERVRAATGIVTTAGYGPRYLHSTGQLHKGGPSTGLFLQLVDEPEELEIPGRPYGFHHLVRAQAAGDFDALRERGLRVASMRLGDV